MLFSIQDKLYYLQKGAGQPHVYPEDLKLIKVPDIIDENLLKKIVSECKKVDNEYNNSRMSDEEYRKKVVAVFERLNVISKTEVE